jgi:hypothetical protein
MKPAFFVAACLSMLPSAAVAQDGNAFRVLATSRTSTMQKEMQAAGDAGFRYAAVMGGETAVGGKEVVVVMQRSSEDRGAKYEYRLLATSRTSTMQKEMQQAADVGYQYVGQTVFESLFGGKEVVVILERNPAATTERYQYRLLATTKTSTLERELREAGEGAWEVVGMTLGETVMGGTELVAIARRRAPK